MSELWKLISQNPLYEVSNLGSVRSAVSKKLCGQWLNGQGYSLVRLSRPRQIFRVHRLVCEAFITNPEQKPFVNHIDCIRSNNIWTNLEWCTQKENLQHADNLGRMQRDYWAGKRSPNAALSDSHVRQIRRIYADCDTSLEKLGRLFGVSKRVVGRVVNLETYRNV